MPAIVSILLLLFLRRNPQFHCVPTMLHSGFGKTHDQLHPLINQQQTLGKFTSVLPSFFFLTKNGHPNCRRCVTRKFNFDRKTKSSKWSWIHKGRNWKPAEDKIRRKPFTENPKLVTAQIWSLDWRFNLQTIGCFMIFSKSGRT